MTRVQTIATKTLAIVLMVGVLVPLLPPKVARADAIPAIVVLNTDPGTIAFYADLAVNTTVSAESDIDQQIVTKILNGIAWAAAKAVVQSMTRSIVNWINSGFNGSPAFEQDLQQSLRKLADGVAMQFAQEFLNNSSINSPYINRAISWTITGYMAYTSRDAIARRLAYTLTEYTQNEQAFRQGDFSQGGWNAWFATVRICGNDPYCVRFATEEELTNRIDGMLRQRLEELNWGNGFLSWRGECLQGASGGGGKVPLGDEEKCLKYEVQTPGSIIEGQLEHALGSPIRQLELADSINEIVGALASQLVTQVIGSTGLLGSTRPTQGGGRSALVQATDPSLSLGFLDGLTTAVANDRTRTTQYQTYWQVIRAAAQGAVDTCVAENDGTREEESRGILNQATTALTRAEGALTSLAEIATRITTVRTATGTDQSTAAAQIPKDYQTLLSSGVIPSTTEVGHARTNSTTTGTPKTLVARAAELKEECDSPSSSRGEDSE